MKDLPSVTITGLVLSDLFFNHEKTNYNAMFDKDAPNHGFSVKDNPEFTTAIRKDAVDFVAMLCLNLTENETINLEGALVKDFFSRI